MTGDKTTTRLWHEALTALAVLTVICAFMVMAVLR
jgi:hypothetical protein